MLKSSARPVIRLRGVRHNNLKNFDLDLPLNQLIVVTGLSGSGKSSLAFDTLFAEGQRRYIETFSPYARQFFDRMDKPQVDSIEGIPPAIAIEQRNAVRTTRSTVGTMTEICDYMKMLWPHISHLHCRQCGRLVRKDSPQKIWESLRDEISLQNPNGQTSGQSKNAELSAQGAQAAEREFLVTFELPLSDKLTLQESLGLISKQGYQRLLLEQSVVRLEEILSNAPKHASRISSLTVVQDRLKLSSSTRARFVEACEQAYHFGKGKLTVWDFAGSASGPRRFSNRLHCAVCDIEYRPASAALFSFNNPVGACPKCRGFGRVISIDYELALPDRSKTLAEGVVKPWLSGQSAECQSDLLRMCRHFEIPTDVPFEKLPRKWQDFVIEGEPDYGKDEEHEWPRAWYGLKGYFRWLESRAYKMHVRVLLSRYRAYTQCPDCHGKRFQPEALWYRCELFPSATPNEPEPVKLDNSRRGKAVVAGRPGEVRPINARNLPESLTIADFYQLPIRHALSAIELIGSRHQLKANDPIGLVLNEVRARLRYLQEVGLGYLTLDRPTRSLSGGETERVNLTTCLGTRLVNTLFVLDEPSVGLHPRDTERLVSILKQLRDAGNTVVVVEHEPSVMRSADQLLDLGPGHGATGGNVVFQGTFSEILKAESSLTGQYLSGREQVEIPQRRPVSLPEERTSQRESRFAPLVLHDRPYPLGKQGREVDWLTLSHASRHNLRDVTVRIPLGRFVCVTGVSGSGKTTLVREVLLPVLNAQLNSAAAQVKASERLDSEENGGEDDSEDEARTGVADEQPCVLQGAEHLARAVLVDQSQLGKTPRSNPAVYVGAFDDIREFFAASEIAKQRGLNASAFSFNSTQGQCERCRGAGFEKIEMQFLSDVFIRCPDCNGRRYRSHILDVKVRSAGSAPRCTSKNGIKTQGPQPHKPVAYSIADLLEATIDEAIDFLSGFADSRPAQRALGSLRLLQEVGLGYLKLGQPINTLSGGESQRLKLVRELGLAQAVDAAAASASTVLPTLFLFDEPTTGLHFDDVRVLLKVFQRLVDAGHSVLVIEHNLDVIKSADWIIDLGPEAGDEGGRLVAEGVPETIPECNESHTGDALRGILEKYEVAKPASRER